MSNVKNHKYEIKSVKKIRNKIMLESDVRNKNPIMFDKHKPNELNRDCSTITAKDRSTPSDMVTDSNYCRKLENHELQILQGFPKDYKFYGNKGSVRRQIGNAVPPPVIRAFFSQAYP